MSVQVAYDFGRAIVHGDEEPPMAPRTAASRPDRPTPRGARFEARLSPVQKGLLQHAADLSGRTLSEFVLKSAEDAAERLVREHAVIRMTREDQAAFVKGLLDDGNPSPRLRRAAAAYRNETGQP
jgi:uncharacterized protein (DUF1778 family)